MVNIEQQPGRSQLNGSRRGPSPGMLAICSGLILILLVGYVYSPCLTAELLVDRDDGHYIYEEGRIWGASWRHAAGSFSRFFFPSETGGYYQPLTNLSYMLDAKIIGLDIKARSFYFHLTNIVLHLLNVAALFVLIRTISGSTGWAFLLAAFFGLHPVQVTSVAWVSQRMTVLATFFALLAIGAYLRYAATEGLRWFFAVIVLTGLAILARPTFLALPVVFLVLDVWPGGRRGNSATARWLGLQLAGDENEPSGSPAETRSPGAYRAIVEKLPLFLLTVWSLGLHLWLHTRVQPIDDAAASGPALVAMNVTSAAERLFFPVRIGPFHPISEEVARPWSPWFVVAGAFLIVLWAFLAIRSLRTNKPLFLALAGTVLWILPAMLDLPYMRELIGDSHLYVAFILPAIALATWLRRRPPVLNYAWGWMVRIAVFGVVLLFGVRSFLQCYVWHDSRMLYAQAILEYPNWPEGYLGLVRSYMHEHDYDAALRTAEKAMEIAPDDPETQFMLGKVLMLHEDGRAQEAIPPLQTALASNPNWIECLKLLGSAMLTTGRLEEARQHLERARNLAPKSPQIRTLLGEVYLETGRPSSARAEFQLALKELSSPAVHLGLARSWAINERPDFACRHLAVAVRLDPRFKFVAAAYPELVALKDTAGFENLIDANTESSIEANDASDPAMNEPSGPIEGAKAEEPPPAPLPEPTPNSLGA